MFHPNDIRYYVKLLNSLMKFKCSLNDCLVRLLIGWVLFNFNYNIPISTNFPLKRELQYNS